MLVSPVKISLQQASFNFSNILEIPAEHLLQQSTEQDVALLQICQELQVHNGKLSCPSLLISSSVMPLSSNHEVTPHLS